MVLPNSSRPRPAVVVLSGAILTELTDVSIPAINCWQSGNLPEALRKFKRTCEYIFNGPLATQDEAVKVKYLMLWVGEEDRDIRDGWLQQSIQAGIRSNRRQH